MESHQGGDEGAAGSDLPESQLALLLLEMSNTLPLERERALAALDTILEQNGTRKGPGRASHRILSVFVILSSLSGAVGSFLVPQLSQLSRNGDWESRHSAFVIASVRSEIWSSS